MLQLHAYACICALPNAAVPPVDKTAADHVPAHAVHLEADDLQELESVWRAGHLALERRVADAYPPELVLARVGRHVAYVSAHDAQAQT